MRGIIWTYASVSGSSVGHHWHASIIYQNLQHWFLISLFCDCYKLTLPLWILWAPLVSLTYKGTLLSLVVVPLILPPLITVTLSLLWWKRVNQTISLRRSWLHP